MKIADLHTSAVSLVKEALEKAKKYADHNIFISINIRKVFFFEILNIIFLIKKIKTS